MPVVGINFTKIEGKVNSENLEAPQINVSSAPKITNLVKKDLNMGDIKSVIEMDFEFDVNYSPNVGSINLKGKIMYHDSNPDKIVKAWKEKKQLDENIAVEVMNVVFRQSLTKAIILSGDLRLPPPLRFPIVQPTSKENAKSEAKKK